MSDAHGEDAPVVRAEVRRCRRRRPARTRPFLPSAPARAGRPELAAERRDGSVLRCDEDARAVDRRARGERPSDPMRPLRASRWRRRSRTSFPRTRSRTARPRSRPAGTRCSCASPRAHVNFRAGRPSVASGRASERRGSPPNVRQQRRSSPARRGRSGGSGSGSGVVSERDRDALEVGVERARTGGPGS